MTTMFLTRETVVGKLASLPPNSRERRPLERFARELTNAELEFEMAMEQALLEAVAADPQMGFAL